MFYSSHAEIHYVEEYIQIMCTISDTVKAATNNITGDCMESFYENNANKSSCKSISFNV